MIEGTGTVMFMPVLGLVFALFFYFWFDTKMITQRTPRINALVRIVFGVMWFIASTFILLVLAVIWIVNWLAQLILGWKEWKNIAEPATDWWLGWTKSIVYGY